MSDLMSKEVAKKTGYNKLNMKVNNLENKIPDVTTFIQINTNQINKKKIRGDQFGKKKNDKKMIKIPDVSALVTITVLNTKIREVQNKIPSGSDLAKKSDYKAEISDNVGKYFTTEYDNFTSEILETKLKETGLLINLIFLSL